MIVKVWGSRGSTPVSGPQYMTYGYNTACLELRSDSGQVILLDAGTGLGAYARDAKNSQNTKPVILLSHLHMDHIQGLPYYAPLYNGTLSIYGPKPDADLSLANGLSRIFDGVLLPVRFKDLKDLDLHEIKAGDKFQIGDFEIESIAANHPGGSVAMRITADAWTLVYTGDHEIPLANATPQVQAINSALLDFMANAELAIVDAHFTQRDHADHQGWGHSHFEQWPEALAARGVKNILFTHFHPEYSDTAIEEAISAIKTKYPQQNILAAYPGLVFDPQNKTHTPTKYGDCPICAFLQQAASLSDTHSVIDALLTEGRRMGLADAGTVYLIENNELVFAAAQNDTLFPKSAANKMAYINARMPINKSSIAGFVASTGTTLNIPDAYNLPENSEFSFNPYFDLANKYRTNSILCVPLINSKKKIIGVLQLINSQPAGVVAPFSQYMEEIISRLAVMATIPLERSLMITSIILRMLQTSALRDPRETAAHVYRVGSIAAELYHHWAEHRDIDPEELLATKSRLRLAAMLHDVGKVGIPDSILKKPGRLDAEERNIMQRHAALGASLFADSLSNIDAMAKNIALHHHAKWDGSGYTGNESIPSPSGDAIPLEARITAIADVYDALVSKRSYKDAWDANKALEVLNKDAGTHFDPELVRCFGEIQDTIAAIMDRYKEKAE